MKTTSTKSYLLPASARAILFGCAAFLSTTIVTQTAQAQAPAKVTFYGGENSPISSGVSIPKNRSVFLSSGIGAPLLKPDAPVGSAERFGDTKTQATGVLNQIRKDLQAIGLDLKDVVYMRVYVAPDRHKENKPDFKGWFDAYAQFFGTEQNPIKVARSTVGVSGLVNPDWLIEIEAVAVYPEEKTKASASVR